MEVLGGLVSVVVQMVAAVVILFCIISLFSLRPGSSKKFVLIGFSYFFSSMVALLVGATVLVRMGSVHLLNLVGAILGAALIHLFYGVLLLILYVGNVISER